MNDGVGCDFVTMNGGVVLDFVTRNGGVARDFVISWFYWRLKDQPPTTQARALCSSFLKEELVSPY
jgi:hypothetical protein